MTTEGLNLVVSLTSEGITVIISMTTDGLNPGVSLTTEGVNPGVSFFLLSFRLIPKKLMSSYTGMEECQKTNITTKRKCKNNL